MNWFTSLWDQLPLLLMLSPVIGFLVTSAAALTERDLVRHFAVSNAVCTLLLFGGVAWQSILERNDEIAARRLVPEPGASARSIADDREILHRQVDKQRADQYSQRWLAVDGINLWPTFVLILCTCIILWRTEEPHNGSGWCAPGVLLFESASIGAMLAYDLRLYLVAFGTAVLIMSVLIGQSGGSQRRTLAERFLWMQLCGGAFVMLGFAMLVMAVPWMKIEDASPPPKALWNIAAIVFEIQKWMSNNQLAFHYAGDVFPWMFCLMSCGFAIQFGLFPFHSPMLAIFRNTPGPIATLCLVGLSSVVGTAWLRFVFPIAPSLFMELDGMIVAVALGSALWGALRAIVPSNPQVRSANIFLSLSGLSLLGCHAFSLTGLCMTWLMQQQLITSLALSWIALGATSVGTADTPPRETSRESNRVLLLMLALFAAGLFASSDLLFSELIAGSLLVLACTLVATILSAIAVYSMFDELTARTLIPTETTAVKRRSHWTLAPLIVAAVIVNLAPNLMLRQCEPEFARHFPRLEPTASANSAATSSDNLPETP
ncbi:proton-translocating NADH-quinone oxidoreductase chain M [Schlesneria paludicola]|uniref:proton-translocating NADH-quinone oxidoreductase chain M n=1 Tax=Schlesneria paludicola TaxID=360056 RepID=UPI000299F462|nr:proton-translocating NADH-quinone oxidoreductase chain M [Schlesneria paludicola]